MVFERDKHENRLVNRFLHRVGKNPFRSRIPAGDDAVQRHADDGIVGALDDCGQAIALCLALLSLGEVAGNRRGSDNLFIRISHRRDSKQDVNFVAVLLRTSGFELFDLFPLHHPFQHLFAFIYSIRRPQN